MTWIGILAITITGLALIPVLFMARIVELRSRSNRQQEGGLFSSGYFTRSRETDERLGFSRENYRRNYHVQEQNARQRRMNERLHSAGVTSDTEARSPFEYTIRRQIGSSRQEVDDMGGFSEVSLLLYDRLGNSFTVYRRLSLN